MSLVIVGVDVESSKIARHEALVFLILFTEHDIIFLHSAIKGATNLLWGNIQACGGSRRRTLELDGRCYMVCPWDHDTASSKAMALAFCVR